MQTPCQNRKYADSPEICGYLRIGNVGLVPEGVAMLHGRYGIGATKQACGVLQEANPLLLLEWEPEEGRHR